MIQKNSFHYDNRFRLFKLKSMVFLKKKKKWIMWNKKKYRRMTATYVQGFTRKVISADYRRKVFDFLLLLTSIIFLCMQLGFRLIIHFKCLQFCILTDICHFITVFCNVFAYMKYNDWRRTENGLLYTQRKKHQIIYLY